MHHPLIGDISYGGDTIAYNGLMNSTNKSKAHHILQLMPHQALHARVLGFTHPRTGESLLFTSLPDQKFLKAMEIAGLEFPESFK
jgi:23S rRNA pseudouridine1911/1915/1917 synthase